MNFLAVDPGIQTGWALFAPDGTFLACGEGQAWPGPVARAIIERPQVYSARQSKGDPNDLITLAIRVGRYVERLERLGAVVDLVLPARWKGQTPKNVHNARVLEALHPSDLTRAETCVSDLRHVTKKSGYTRDDVIDAIGLGRWAFRSGPWRT